MSDHLSQLQTLGVSVWLDDLSRQRITSGSLQELIANGDIAGVTTNPSIFQAAIAQRDPYDEAIADARSRGLSAAETISELTESDVRDACDLFTAVYEQSAGVDGRVSIEVEPKLARDTAATIEQAVAIWERVNRPNLMIKVPATTEGLPAIAELLSRGISVNVTLIFSLKRYREVINAYLTGIERARLNGHDLSQIHSVASFFVSRLDTAVDAALRASTDPATQDLTGTAGVANAQMAYEVFQQCFSSERWSMLRDSGANLQRPLWASTGVKDPALPDTLYVTQLAGPNVVNTMPEATLDAVRDHGTPQGDTLTGVAREAGRKLDAVQRAGIDYAAVTAQLEEEGLQKFVDAWDALTAEVTERLT